MRVDCFPVTLNAMVRKCLFPRLLVSFLMIGFLSCSSGDVVRNTQRVWSNRPAYTKVFENQNEYGLTSDACDGIWEGEQVPELPRVPHPSPEVKRWLEAEGFNYLDEETDSLTRGKYQNPVRIWEGEP